MLHVLIKSQNESELRVNVESVLIHTYPSGGLKFIFLPYSTFSYTEYDIQCHVYLE